EAVAPGAGRPRLPRKFAVVRCCHRSGAGGRGATATRAGRGKPKRLESEISQQRSPTRETLHEIANLPAHPHWRNRSLRLLLEVACWGRSGTTPPLGEGQQPGYAGRWPDQQGIQTRRVRMPRRTPPPLARLIPAG